MVKQLKTRFAPKPATRPETLRVFIADDHALVRELTVALLRKQPRRFQIVGQASTAEEAIRGCAATKPHLLVLDFKFPGLTGVDAVPKLRNLSPATRILVCSGSASDHEVMEAFQVGVDGFMSKTSSPSELLTALEQLGRGEKYFCNHAVSVLAEATRRGSATPENKTVATITQREKEVLRLIATGQTSKEIAATLGISLATVETHRRNVMVKAGARNTAGLIRYGQEHGLLSMPGAVA